MKPSANHETGSANDEGHTKNPLKQDHVILETDLAHSPVKKVSIFRGLKDADFSRHDPGRQETALGTREIHTHEEHDALASRRNYIRAMSAFLSNIGSTHQ